MLFVNMASTAGFWIHILAVNIFTLGQILWFAIYLRYSILFFLATADCWKLVPCCQTGVYILPLILISFLVHLVVKLHQFHIFRGRVHNYETFLMLIWALFIAQIGRIITPVGKRTLPCSWEWLHFNIYIGSENKPLMIEKKIIMQRL